MAGRLDGRVCVVTGASGGIGAASVDAFRREGATVVGIDLLAGAPGDIALEADVTSEEQVRDALAQVRAQCGHIDVLFNNAGISPTDDGSVLETTLDAWERVQQVNLRSVFLCCKHGIPHLLDNDGPLRGSVINTASFVAVMGAATSQISYTASKGGVLALSRELGVEFARRGVRVNALCPGPVDTPLLRELFAKDPDKAARRLVHVPMGRFARAEEIAAGALFLASDESSFVTASTFLVDGGLSGALHDADRLVGDRDLPWLRRRGARIRKQCPARARARSVPWGRRARRRTARAAAPSGSAPSADARRARARSSCAGRACAGTRAASARGSRGCARRARPAGARAGARAARARAVGRRSAAVRRRARRCSPVRPPVPARL